MFGSEILDIALGLVLVFLMMSFIASAIREAIEAVIKARAVHLERGVIEMLGTELTAAFYQHPAIFPLFDGEYTPPVGMKDRFFGHGLPTYIPARSFATTIIDLAVRGAVPDEYAAMHTAPAITVAAVRERAATLSSPRVARALMMAADHATSLDGVIQNLQSWYDSVMDRVSGRYKRRTQGWLFGIGLVTAVIFNVNAIVIADHLSTNRTLREALAKQAEAIATDTAYLRRVRREVAAMNANPKDTLAPMTAGELKRISTDLTALQLPIMSRGVPRLSTAHFGGNLVGWLITALAVTLGAPFWFDILNKIMVIRSTVKPREKSPEEGSEDRKAARSDNAGSVPANQPVTAPATSPFTNTINANAALATGRPAERREWASGDPDEGIL